MKQKVLSSLFLLMTMLLGVPLEAFADREVNQLQFGKQTITVASDEVITFYDFMGNDDIPSANSSNSQSLTVFTPAEAGKSVQITFEEIDIIPDMSSGSYPAYMKVYSGTPSDEGFTWATQASDVNKNSPLPDGNVLVTRGGMTNSEAYTSTTPETYVSEAADGSMAVGFIYVYAKKCKGWKATVKCVTLENMTVTGAGSSYDNVSATITKKQNVDLATAYVTAEGVMNPDKVTSISFNLTQNEGMVDPTALKLFFGDEAISATVSEEGSGYKFALSQALSDGTNNFNIKGDILETAEIGAKVQLDVTNIATEGQPEGVTPFTAGTPVAVENPAIVIMTSTPQTITVGETPLQFYDEGGKDGSIKGTASGQVTFLSGVEGKKVMVDLSKLVINNGSMYHQTLKFYNGTEATAANLITEKLNGETGIVRSTAEDGSMTVVLEAASQNYDYDGFEAEVSLFVPQPMDFDGITSAVASTETVAAGDTEQDILTITVKAKDTEPAMQVQKMAFSADDTYALISKASLYFGTTKVGEAEVNADNFEITLTTPQALVEGENVFTLKYDISEEALNSEFVSAEVVSVTALVNGSAKTENVSGGTIADRMVKNEVVSHADQGTVTKTVNGSIDFYTKTAGTYSSYCEAGTDDRINIFIPKHEGMVTQIDFSEFNVQYASSSYGNKSTFKIYAGQGTSGELLWELNSNDQESTGPGKTIRSTAADGSLTIVFNPKSSYSYYYKGFKATVSEYLSKPMAVTGVEVEQASTADASIGANEQDLLNVNVKTEGNLEALQLSSMKINLKGTEVNISNVSVWQDDTKLGEATAAAEVTVTLSEAIVLAEGDNIFTVKVDVKADAEENSTIDAKLVSVNAGSEVEVTNGDPEGERTLKNQILMTQGFHGTVNLGLGQIVNLYDDGGPEGDGADGVTATITFAPTGDADCIRLTDKGIEFASTAHLYIYKGSEELDENQIIDLSGSSAKFDPIISDADVNGGKITIKYIGKGSYFKPNFAMLVEGYKKTDVEVTGVTAEDISTNEVLKGQTDTKMLKIMVEAKGDLTPVEITAFDITGTDGEAVENYHIYQTGTTTTFSANEEFNGSYSVTKFGTYYFWLTYDVKADASVGTAVSATLNSITVDGTTIPVEEPVTATFTVASGKSGTYTVGQGGDYATIQGAIDDIGVLGMDGAVTLKIKAGDYNEKVRIPNIKGMGAVNTLTLESESGERDVKIYHNNYTTGGYSDDQHKKDYGVVTLYQANYVTLKNLEIYTTDKAYKAVVMVKDESRHATIDNCYLHAPICTASTGEDVVLIGHTIIDEENKNNDYLTVKNCLLEGGKMGVSMGGTSYVALPKEVGGVIEGNTFKNNGTKAIYVMDELGVKIKNNTVTIDADAETKISVGILDMQLRDEYDEATEITGNIFNVAPKTYAAVMNLRQLEGKAEAPVLIANNVINLASLSASYAAFKFNGAKVKNVNVAYNTIRMTGTEGGAAFWASSKLDDGYGNVNVVNNIIQNETSGYAVNLYNDANLGTDRFNFQNNVIYTSGETFFRASSSTTGDFDAFVTATGATGSINKQVTFLSNEILEPANDLDGDLLTAKALAYVTTDINGKERPAENITIGAYEYDPNAMSAPVMQDGYPQVITHLDGKASFSVKTDIAATVYYIVKKSDETAPTAEELKASETKKDVAANAETIIEVEGLEDNAEYIAYFLPVSLRGVDAESTSQTTAFTMDVTPPVTDAPEAEVYINNSTEEETIASGETVNLMAMVLVDERTAPYTLTWMDSKHNVLLTETFESADDIDDIFMTTDTPTECTDYIFVVTDAAEKGDTATVRAIVTGDLQVADFEKLYLPEESFERGENLQLGSFVSGSFKFDNGCMPEWSYFYDFMYANTTSTSFTTYVTDQFNNAVGGGVNGSENYVVAYPQGGKIYVMNNADGDVIPGMYITNDAWVVDNILNGDGMTDGVFKQGDWFKLTITADNGNSTEYYLADYRAEQEADRYYLDTWQWIDLSKLGTVKNLSFSFDGSRKNSWGLTTATYFCLDNLGDKRPETTATLEITEGTTASIAEAFTLGEQGTVTYAIADALPEELAGIVSLEGDVLTVDTYDAKDFEIVISATQRGKTQYVRYSVSKSVTTGIIEFNADDENIEGRYTLDGKKIIDKNHRGIEVVRMKDGSVRKVVVK